MKSKKVALHNLGCKVNAYETEAMQQILERNGYEIVPFDVGADIYVINTCTVTNIADRKSRQMLHKAKKMNPNAIVVAAGCYVQAAGDALKADEAIDIIIGNNIKQDLVDILEAYDAAHNGVADFDEVETLIDINHTKEYEKLQIDHTAEHTRAYIKVQDGCNQFCSYCIIPYARGRVRSRELDDILAEVNTLADNGYQEVVLTGIHLSSYGVDMEGDLDLLKLILAVNDIPGIKRIRLGSLEPRIITEEFARTIGSLDKMCPHFHLSLQSGCNETLQRMNRRYTAEEFYEKCELLRKYFDDPALTTDVIVGFPQESEQEFETTKQFLEKVRFYETHIFKYSRRKGTKADKMSGQIPESVKGERSHILLTLNEKNKKEYEQRFVGKKLEVLFEEAVMYNGKACYQGYSKEYIKVIRSFDQQNMTNKICDCILVDSDIE